MRVGWLARCLLALLPLAIAIPQGPIRSVAALALPGAAAELTTRATPRLASMPLLSEPNVGQASPITYHPNKKVKAHITVQVDTSRGLVTKKTIVTILPHA